MWHVDVCSGVGEFNGESGGDVCIHVSVHADFFLAVAVVECVNA